MFPYLIQLFVSLYSHYDDHDCDQKAQPLISYKKRMTIVSPLSVYYSFFVQF